MSPSWILNIERQRNLSKRWRFKINQQVELMHLETEVRDLFLLSSLLCLNEKPKVRFAISHFLWIMKCNLREQMPNQVSFWNKSQCFFWRISRPKFSSHNPWSARSVLWVFLASYILVFHAPILFQLMCVLWLKGV